MANRVIGGLLSLKIDGQIYQAVGSFTFNQGLALRATLIGATGVDGYSVTPQAAFIEGEIRDGSEIDLEALVGSEDVTASLELANGKTFVLSAARFIGEGTGNTAESNFAVRFESSQQGVFV